MTTLGFRHGVAFVVILALLLRVAFLFGNDVQSHFAGDINDYVHYAWNMAYHGVYSSAPSNPEVVPAPDSFRPPGYPLFLMLALHLSTIAGKWLGIAYALQILVSTATVWLTILLAREIMRPAYALAAGLLIALWPHHVSFSSTLLSETLFGLSLVSALLLTVLAKRKTSVALAVAAGFAFGYAALINTLALPLGFVAAALMLGRGSHWKLAAILLASFIVLPLAWHVASPERQGGARTASSRALMNIVQGSWPQYHLAWQTRGTNETSRLIMASIDVEVTEAIEDPSVGFSLVRARVSSDPSRYLKWYIVEKPWLLWDWDIRLGWRDIHFLPSNSSPFERHPAFIALHRGIKTVNPLVFALALFTIFQVLKSLALSRMPPFGLLLTSAFVAYVTLLHTLLQAEPRYSIPYRPEQLILACYALQWLCAYVKSEKPGQPSAPDW